MSQADPYWSNFDLTTWGGTVIASSSPSGMLSRDEQNPEFTSAFAKALTGKLSHTDVYLDKSGASAMLFMAPVLNWNVPQKPLVGVLIGQLQWSTIENAVKTASNEPNTEIFNSNGLAIASNINRTVLARNEKSTAAYAGTQTGSSGIEVAKGMFLRNPKALIAYAKEPGYATYTGNNWTYVTEIPLSTILAIGSQAGATVVKLVLVVVPIALTSIALSFWILVFRPVRRLRQATSRLSKGDYSQRINAFSDDELGGLSSDFNEMADKIEANNKAILKHQDEMQQSERTIQNIIDKFPIGVLLVEAPSGKLVYMNKAAEILSGHSANVAGKSIMFNDAYEVVLADGTPYPLDKRPMSVALKTGKTVLKDDTYILQPGGTIIPVKTVASPIMQSDGTFNRLVSVFEDISKERQLEHSREEFFSIASHELRTPLTAILGNTAMIQDYFWDQLPSDEVRSMISDVNESSHRLISIVNDFLDTSRLEQQRMKFKLESIDLEEVANSVVKEYSVTGAHRKIEIGVTRFADKLPKVTADANRVKQVLINLVGNALKFTTTGTITISFALTKSSVHVSVTDTGMGMDAEAQKHLFVKFEQTGPLAITRDSVRGTGLGLYISKMIIEQMHGHIKLASSDPGEGSVFTFSLPIVKPDDANEDHNLPS
jgi:signal transduction histidine kinase